MKAGIDSLEALDEIAAVAGAVTGEIIEGSEMSGVALGALVNASETGRFVVAGGAKALETAWCAAIQQAGGKVVKDASIKGLILDSMAGDNLQQFAAAGITVLSQNGEELLLFGEQSVVSGMGVLCTHSVLLPPEAVTPERRDSIAGLHEAPPIASCVFWLSGDPASLCLSSTEYVEVEPLSEPPSAGRRFTRIFSPSAMDPTWTTSHPADVSAVVVEINLSETSLQPAALRWSSEDTTTGPVFFTNEKEPETNPNHPLFALRFGRRFKLSEGRKSELLRQAERKLLEIYPQCSGRITFRHFEEPMLGGHKVRETTAKYQVSASAAQTDVKVRLVYTYVPVGRLLIGRIDGAIEPILDWIRSHNFRIDGRASIGMDHSLGDSRYSRQSSLAACSPV